MARSHPGKIWCHEGPCHGLDHWFPSEATAKGIWMLSHRFWNLVLILLLLGAGSAVQVGAPNKAWGLRACKVFLVFNQRRNILPSWDTCLEEADYLFIKRSGLLRMSLPSFLFHCVGRRWGLEWEDAGPRGGERLRKLARYSVSSENCPAGFCAMADLVSVRSLAFLDGPTEELHLKFAVVLRLWRQKERNQTGRRGGRHRHPHAIGCRREGHSAGLPARTVCVLIQGS